MVKIHYRVARDLAGNVFVNGCVVAIESDMPLPVSEFIPDQTRIVYEPFDEVP